MSRSHVLTFATAVAILGLGVALTSLNPWQDESGAAALGQSWVEQGAVSLGMGTVVVGAFGARSRRWARGRYPQREDSHRRRRKGP